MLQLADNTLVFDDWNTTDEVVINGVHGSRTHVFATDLLYPREQAYGVWWRGDTILRNISF